MVFEPVRYIDKKSQHVHRWRLRRALSKTYRPCVNNNYAKGNDNQYKLMIPPNNDRQRPKQSRCLTWN